MTDFTFHNEDIIKLLISAGTGALIGFEREYNSKSAGLRTMILICIGSTLFTIISIKLGNDPSRIAANIVTGIGFIGGGIIFKESSSGQISGITTAATVWITAALGMCVGFGDGLYSTGLVAMVLVLFTLYPLLYVQKRINKRNQVRNYKIVCEFKNQSLKHYEEKFEQFGLETRRSIQTKTAKVITGNWIVVGTEKSHEKAIKNLLHDAEIIEFEF